MGGGTTAKEPERADLKLLLIQPGKATSHHFHLLRKSWFYVLSGTLRVSSSFDCWQQVLETGDALELDPGEDHTFLNTGTIDAQVLEVGSPGHLPHDKISFKAQDVVRASPPGRFWQRNGGFRLKAGGVDALEMACLCHNSEVDAIGLELDGDNWSQRLARLEWIKRLPQQMSLFLVTHLTQPRLVTAILHQLGCDTLQWCGSANHQALPTLYAFVRDHGYRIVHTLSGSHDRCLEEINRIRSWTFPLDGLIWQPEVFATDDPIIHALEAMNIPWMVAPIWWRDDLEILKKNKNFIGIDVRETLWKKQCGDAGMLTMDPEKIQLWLRSMR
ncbi:MAG: Cupin 2 protein [Magnetococcales bacterium]|nr:Cupin 2 protein [Magnetococcales bacterium]